MKKKTKSNLLKKISTKSTCSLTEEDRFLERYTTGNFSTTCEH